MMFSTGPTTSGLPVVEGADGDSEAALALVLRLMRRGFELPGYEEPTRLLVGRLPDPLPVPVPMPAGARVAGSQIEGPNTTMVLDVNQAPPAVLDFYREKLLADGWRIHEPHMMHGGFMAGTFTPPLTYYKGTRGPSLSLRATALDGGSTDLRLNLNTDARQSFAAARMRHAGMRDLLPSLTPSPGMRLLPQGSGSGGSSYYSSATLQTDLEPAAISAHFTGQLSGAGWTLTNEDHAGPAAWSTWTFTDQEGEIWRGMLLVIRHIPEGNEFILDLRADLATGDDGSRGYGSHSITSR